MYPCTCSMHVCTYMLHIYHTLVLKQRADPEFRVTVLKSSDTYKTFVDERTLVFTGNVPSAQRHQVCVFLL